MQQYKFERVLHPIEAEKVPQEVVEKNAMISFFKNLPIEVQKSIVNFEWIDINYCCEKIKNTSSRSEVDYWTSVINQISLYNRSSDETGVMVRCSLVSNIQIPQENGGE